MSVHEHETPEILATRGAMVRAGWKYAVDCLPGAYIPREGTTGIEKPSDWIVDVEAVSEPLKSFYTNDGLPDDGSQDST